MADTKIIDQSRQIILGVVSSNSWLAPSLTDKFLGRPPFTFLLAIVSEVIKVSGYGEGLFTEEEIAKAKTSKSMKIRFLVKILHFVAMTTDERVDIFVVPANVLSGQEPQATNLFLQALCQGAQDCDAERSAKAVAEINGKDLNALYTEGVRTRKQVIKMQAVFRGNVARRKARDEASNLCSMLKNAQTENKTSWSLVYEQAHSPCKDTTITATAKTDLPEAVESTDGEGHNRDQESHNAPEQPDTKGHTPVHEDHFDGQEGIQDQRQSQNISERRDSKEQLSDNMDEVQGCGGNEPQHVQLSSEHSNVPNQECIDKNQLEASAKNEDGVDLNKDGQLQAQGQLSINEDQLQGEEVNRDQEIYQNSKHSSVQNQGLVAEDQDKGPSTEECQSIQACADQKEVPEKAPMDEIPEKAPNDTEKMLEDPVAPKQEQDITPSQESALPSGVLRDGGEEDPGHKHDSKEQNTAAPKEVLTQIQAIAEQLHKAPEAGAQAILAEQLQELAQKLSSLEVATPSDPPNTSGAQVTGDGQSERQRASSGSQSPPTPLVLEKTVTHMHPVVAPPVSQEGTKIEQTGDVKKHRSKEAREPKYLSSLHKDRAQKPPVSSKREQRMPSTLVKKPPNRNYESTLNMDKIKMRVMGPRVMGLVPPPSTPKTSHFPTRGKEKVGGGWQTGRELDVKLLIHLLSRVQRLQQPPTAVLKRVEETEARKVKKKKKKAKDGETKSKRKNNDPEGENKKPDEKPVPKNVTWEDGGSDDHVQGSNQRDSPKGEYKKRAFTPGDAFSLVVEKLHFEEFSGEEEDPATDELASRRSSERSVMTAGSEKRLMPPLKMKKSPNIKAKGSKKPTSNKNDQDVMRRFSDAYGDDPAPTGFRKRQQHKRQRPGKNSVSGSQARISRRPELQQHHPVGENEEEAYESGGEEGFYQRCLAFYQQKLEQAFVKHTARSENQGLPSIGSKGEGHPTSPHFMVEQSTLAPEAGASLGVPIDLSWENFRQNEKAPPVLSSFLPKSEKPDAVFPSIQPKIEKSSQQSLRSHSGGNPGPSLAAGLRKTKRKKKKIKNSKDKGQGEVGKAPVRRHSSIEEKLANRHGSTTKDMHHSKSDAVLKSVPKSSKDNPSQIHLSWDEDEEEEQLRMLKAENDMKGMEKKRQHSNPKRQAKKKTEKLFGSNDHIKHPEVAWLSAFDSKFEQALGKFDKIQNF